MRVYTPFSFCPFLSASKEKTHREAIPKGTPKQSQVQKIYSRKAAAPSPKGGLLKSSKAAPSKSLQRPSWQCSLWMCVLYSRGCWKRTSGHQLAAERPFWYSCHTAGFFCNQNQTLNEVPYGVSHLWTPKELPGTCCCSSRSLCSLLLVTLFVLEVGERQVMLQGKQMACSAADSWCCLVRAVLQGQVRCQASNYIPLGPFSSNHMPSRKLECLPFTHTGSICTQAPRPLRSSDGFLRIRVGTIELFILSRDAEVSSTLQMVLFRTST